jgi:hypothetical protein
LRIDDIQSGLTFYGYIPRESSREHLGIVLLHDDINALYCYCTSQERIKLLYPDEARYTLPKEVMKKYFPNSAKESYIVLSNDHIFNMLCVTFVSKINNGEFENLGVLDRNIFTDLIQSILQSPVVSKRLKEYIKTTFNA